MCMQRQEIRLIWHRSQSNGVGWLACNTRLFSCLKKPKAFWSKSNLTGTYNAIGRLDDAIKILEYVVRTREEKLGTVNPEVYDEKKRRAELVKEAEIGET